MPKNERRPRLSIVLPCFRSGRLAIESVKRLRQEFSDFGDTLEILVVDDGGGDLEASTLGSLGARLHVLPVNRGKGAAVRAGMLAVTGDVRVFTDVDVPYGTDGIRAAEHYIAKRGFHVVIGDRTLPGSLYSQRLSPIRRLASRAFTVLVGRLVTGGFFDTQCGLKGFRHDVAESLFRVSRVERFAFDVELVYLALKNKLDIKRIAVRLERNEESSVRVSRDAPRMLADVVTVILDHYRGRHDHQPLLDLVSSDEQRERKSFLTR